jgi:hypothetical protein
MLEVTKKGKFVTDFYGSAPALDASEILKKWLEDKQNDWLLSWADQKKKKGQEAINVLEEILSIFHRDENNYPILGSWMLRRCLVVTGQTIFNAMKNKTDPKKDLIPMAVQLVEPINMNIYNGSIVKEPFGVKTCTITKTTSGKSLSFFKAYEYIKSGTTFETIITFDDELITEEHINKLLSKCGSVGVGAFRERFGKFIWI